MTWKILPRGQVTALLTSRLVTYSSSQEVCISTSHPRYKVAFRQSVEVSRNFDLYQFSPSQSTSNSLMNAYFSVVNRLSMLATMAESSPTLLACAPASSNNFKIELSPQRAAPSNTVIATPAEFGSAPPSSRVLIMLKVFCLIGTSVHHFLPKTEF